MDDRLTRADTEPTGVLATTRPDGNPHAVPVVFALLDDTLVTPIDWKTKSGGPLQRVINIRSNPKVSFLVHHYSDVWEELWWVRVDGNATVHEDDTVWDQALEELSAKYTHYRERPFQGPVIRITPDRISSWENTD